MDNKDNARGQVAEKIIRTDYEVANIKVFSLMIAKEHNKLNKVGLSEFLKDYDRGEELISTLEQINKQRYCLPDFICIDCAKKIFFVEVKSWTNKVTLSAIDEREAIKILANKGYTCLIKNVEIPSSEDMSDREIERQLKEYGQVMKGISKGNPLYYMAFLKEKIQSKPYPNVAIWNLIVNLNKNNVS